MAAPEKKAIAKRRARPSVAKNDGRNGGARRGSGRKVGAATKKTREIADKISSDGGLTPLDYLLNVLRTGPDEIKVKHEAGELDDAEYLLALESLTHRRDWAADKAAPYIHPRLASITEKGAGGGHEDWLAVIEEGNEAGKQL